MYDLSVADVDSHMAGIAYDISGLCIFQSAYIRAYISVCRWGMRKGNTEVLIYAHYKTGAVRTVCKACPAIYIRVANKLYRIIRNCTPWLETAARLRKGFPPLFPPARRLLYFPEKQPFLQSKRFRSGLLFPQWFLSSFP